MFLYKYQIPVPRGSARQWPRAGISLPGNFAGLQPDHPYPWIAGRFRWIACPCVFHT